MISYNDLALFATIIPVKCESFIAQHKMEVYKDDMMYVANNFNFGKFLEQNFMPGKPVLIWLGIQILRIALS